MVKTFTVDLNTLTTTTDISNYIRENLTGFEEYFNVVISSSGYINITPLNCENWIQYRPAARGSESQLYCWNSVLSDYYSYYSEGVTINDTSYNVNVYTNEDNHTFAIFFGNYTRLKSIVTKDKNGDVQIITQNGYDYSDLRIKRPTGYYNNSTFLHDRCSYYTNKCYIINMGIRSGNKIVDNYMIDTFEVALPVYISMGNKISIDGEKYVVFANDDSSSNFNVIAFKYTE